ncbi:MAG: type II secretion system F family protein [Pseudomonadota bacterium]
MSDGYFYQATTEATDATEVAHESTNAPVGGIDAPNLLQRLETSLVDAYGPAAPLYAIIAIGILITLVALPMVMKKRKDPLERFSFRDARRDDDLVALRTENDDGRLSGIGEYLQPSDQGELSETRKLLRSAGYKDASAVRVYYFARAALGSGLLLLATFVFLVRPEDPDPAVALAFAVVFGLAGYFLPIYWVRRQIETRRQEIENAFPDAMDMMLVCIEGGQSLDQAMARVGVEMKASASPLAEELNVVSDEFRAGKDRVSVLRDFASRCSVNDISSFVTVLIQSQAFGTSVSQALRVYAAEMRDKRLVRAEEKANVLPTKLTLGTMMFTVPPLILILVGPSVIQIIRSLSGLSSGG